MAWSLKASKSKESTVENSNETSTNNASSRKQQLITSSAAHDEELMAAYNKGVSDAIKDVLEEIDEQANKRVEGGMNEKSFTLGVLNCFFILIMFGVYPQHFWLVYLVEALYFIPVKFMELTQAVPNQTLYYLDFCWVMNISGIIAFLVLMFGRGSLPAAFHEWLFDASFGIACGPLLGATAALPFVALVFHEVKSMTSIFIHIFPPLLFYVLRWDAAEVANSWPNTFLLDYDVVFFPNANTPFLQTVFGASVVVYTAWFTPYAIWQILVGFDLPKEGRYDTVFHANMRNGLCVTFGELVWDRPKKVSLEQVKTNDFEFRDLVLYMSGHVILFLFSLVFLAYPCNLNRYVHASFLGFCAIICAWRGAKRYTYYSTKMYSRLIRKKFAGKLQKEESTSQTNDQFQDSPQMANETYYQLNDRESLAKDAV